MPAKGDSLLIRARSRRCLHTYDRQATAQRAMAERLLAALREHGPRHYRRVLEIGCGTGLLTRRFLAEFSPEEMVLSDLVPDYADALGPILEPHRETAFTYLSGNIEGLPLPGGLDLVISNAVLHWIHDLPALVARLHGVLREGGRLAVTMCGPGNLHEIRSLTRASLSYLSLNEVTSALANMFVIRSAAEFEEVVEFASPTAVLRHLRETGVNTLRKEHWTRPRLRAFERAYERMYGRDGVVSLTYHAFVVVAEKT